MRQRESEMVGGRGQARVDEVVNAVAHGGVQNRRVPPDDLVVLGVTSGNQHQGRHSGEVEAHVVSIAAFGRFSSVTTLDH
ncbi:hypothetical protein [Streptomyces sp. NPDC058335]|uniref:hypothetical protein n=1 Tax=Streptomyces sp. NPDC058335 TaxID=3346451 RepID=UPI003649FD0A